MRARLLVNVQQMNLITRQGAFAIFQPKLMAQVPVRYFSSLPDHVKLEMPNLSPTMEKVSYLLDLVTFLGKH